MIDIIEGDLDRTRTVTIQVKTRRVGTWQASVDDGRRAAPAPDKKHFWIFVDLSEGMTSPGYYVVPGSWIRKSISEVHSKYLKRHGGTRPRNPRAKHHGIDSNTKRIQEWKDRWDILRLF
jgi:hypothetical protein